MRLILLLVVLFTATLSAQDASYEVEQFVWAESGLVLRDKGDFAGNKITMIPYGSKVETNTTFSYAPTGIEVQAVPKRVFEDVTIPEWKMSGGFVQVRYDGLEGYVYSGYLSHYDPAMLKVDSLYHVYKFTCPVADTLFTNVPYPDGEFGENSILYENGITTFSFWDKAGGGGTITIPNASLATGYLIAEKFFRLGIYDPEYGSWENPTITARTENSLTFQFQLTVLTITEIGGTVTITHDSHC